MTLSEFKAWLEGYSASFKDGVPDAAQWAEVQAKLATVEPLKLQYVPYPLGTSPGMTTPWISDRPGPTPYYVGDPIPPIHEVTCAAN